MRKLWFVLLICAALTAMAQPAAKTAFKTLGMSDGLRSNSVVCMLADSRGYLWIGTQQGLNRYDGYEVKSRFAESSNPKFHELMNNPISAMQEDVDGRIWIQTSSGAYYIYDGSKAQFSDNATETLRNAGIRCAGRYRIKIGRSGRWWVIADGRLWRHDSRTKQTSSWRWTVPEVSTLADVVAETSDGLYVSADNAIWHFDSNTGETERMALPQQMANPLAEIGLMADADGSLWAYSTREEYVCRYMVGGRCTKEMLQLPHRPGDTQNDAIRHMADDGRGNIWIATDHRGLFVYNKKSGTIESIQHRHDQLMSLASDNATCLTIDGEGTLWVGHMKAGISYTSEFNSIMQSHERQCGDILAMEYDTHGNLWMGTDGNGVYIRTTDGSTVKTALPSITVMDLLSDGQGGMWVGTYNQGLFHMSDARRWERFAPDDGSFPTAEAWTLASDGRGNIWASSPIGKTTMFNISQKKATVVTADSGGDIHGNKLYCDGRGRMYIGSVYGLWTYELGSGEMSVSFGNRKGSQQWLDLMITDMAIDHSRGLMVLAHQHGVTLYDVERDTLSFIPRNNDEVKGMARDHNDTYWLCTSRGNIMGIQLERKQGRMEVATRTFSPSAGLAQFYFNNGAMACSPQGEILLGGTEGYMTINPRQLMTAKHQAPDLVISEIAVGDSLINETISEIRFPYDEAYLSVKFFAGSLEGVQRMRYAYRLVGLMSDWVTTDRNYVAFNALPAGNYTLQLCVYLEDGTMSNPRELRITVTPPFYRSMPMYILYVLTAIAVLCLVWLRIHRRQQERAQRQQQLMERQKMEQITEMKLSFFTNISHDLRTPLTLIISPLERMVKKMEDGGTPDNLLQQLRNIHKNAQLLLQQVSTLLDFRRLDAGGERLNRQRGDIVDHLNSILASFDDYATERGIRLSFEHSADSFIMSYDREKMNKVIYNLLSNALKFTPSGGSVTLHFSQQQDGVTIAVADTGKGVADSDKPNIFRRFYQSASNDSSQTGSGIGLHIASDYVRLHHGTISVSDNQPAGAVFTIHLPVTADEHSAAADDSRAALQHDAESGKSILVVDDNHDMLSFVSSCMSEDYLVHTATDGAAALDILQREQIDLIISDVMMPGIDGFELCRRVKSDISMSHIPVILLTARDTDVSRIEGLQLGADDYLTKPFNIEVLRLRVQKFIEWKQDNHKKFRQKMNVEPAEITITPLDEQFIQKAMAMVEKNIGDSDFSVETMAAELAMSRSNLYKKFMAITGLGPSEFIRTIRIKRGRALLETSQMQITEIAYAVGFTTVKSFTMNFKSEYGMTPSEFRQQRTKTE